MRGDKTLSHCVHRQPGPQQIANGLSVIFSRVKTKVLNNNVNGLCKVSITLCIITGPERVPRLHVCNVCKTPRPSRPPLSHFERHSCSSSFSYTVFRLPQNIPRAPCAPCSICSATPSSRRTSTTWSRARATGGWRLAWPIRFCLREVRPLLAPPRGSTHHAGLWHLAHPMRRLRV